MGNTIDSPGKDYDTSVEFPEGVVAIKRFCKSLVERFINGGQSPTHVDIRATREDFWRSYDATITSLTPEEITYHQTRSTERNRLESLKKS